MPLFLLAAPAGLAADAPNARTCSATALDATAAGWVSPDSEASVERGHDAGVQLRYRVRPGAVSLLARGGLDLRGCASLSFRVRASHSGGLAFGVSEADESRYGSVTRVEAGRRADVRLNLDEMQLAEDSKDEDGRLDLGPGLALWFLDVAAVGQARGQAARGERTLWIDQVNFSAERAPDAGRRLGAEAGTLVLDTFETNLVRWMPVAVRFEPRAFRLYPEEAQVAVAREEAAAGSVLEVLYPQAPMSAFVLSRDVAGLDLSRAERVVFRLRSERPAAFFVALEERNGARYEHPFEVSPDRWQRVELPLERFRLAGDSRDPNGRLDLDSVKLLSIVAARLEPGPSRPNRLGLDDPGFVLSAAADRPTTSRR